MEGGYGGRPEDPTVSRAPRRAPWPPSAIVAVAVCLVLVVLLAILNLLGVQVGSGYEPDVGGTATTKDVTDAVVEAIQSSNV